MNVGFRYPCHNPSILECAMEQLNQNTKLLDRMDKIFQDEQRLLFILFGSILNHRVNPVEKECLNVLYFDLDAKQVGFPSMPTRFGTESYAH